MRFCLTAWDMATMIQRYSSITFNCLHYMPIFACNKAWENCCNNFLMIAPGHVTNWEESVYIFIKWDTLHKINIQLVSLYFPMKMCTAIYKYIHEILIGAKPTLVTYQKFFYLLSNSKEYGFQSYMCMCHHKSLQLCLWRSNLQSGALTMDREGSFICKKYISQ